MNQVVSDGPMGEMTEFLRVWKRDSVMANCYDRHLMTDGVRWTDWKIFPRQVPESLDWSYHLDRWIKMHRQTKSVHEKPEESDWMNDKLNSIGVRWKQMVGLCLCVLPRSKKNMYYRYGCSCIILLKLDGATVKWLSRERLRADDQALHQCVLLMAN